MIFALYNKLADACNFIKVLTSFERPDRILFYLISWFVILSSIENVCSWWSLWRKCPNNLEGAIGRDGLYERVQLVNSAKHWVRGETQRQGRGSVDKQCLVPLQRKFSICFKPGLVRSCEAKSLILEATFYVFKRREQGKIKGRSEIGLDSRTPWHKEVCIKIKNISFVLTSRILKTDSFRFLPCTLLINLQARGEREYAEILLQYYSRITILLRRAHGRDRPQTARNRCWPASKILFWFVFITNIMVGQRLSSSLESHMVNQRHASPGRIAVQTCCPGNNI